MRHVGRYAARRLRAELRTEGHAIGRYALRSWLHRLGLRALSTRLQRPRTTVADPAAVVAENRLMGQPAPTAQNQVWVGDITYLPLATQTPTEFVLHALEEALTLRQPAPGLIIHADRGSQYTSVACRTRIAQAGAGARFNWAGNP